MCIGSNSVNQAQDSMSVTKFEDLPNSLIPSPSGFVVLMEMLWFNMNLCGLIWNWWFAGPKLIRFKRFEPKSTVAGGGGADLNFLY